MNLKPGIYPGVPFDEYQVRKRIRVLHPGWSEIEISDEIEMQKRHYKRENHNRLTWFAQNTVKDIEKLIKSLEQAIVDWKILNL